MIEEDSGASARTTHFNRRSVLRFLTIGLAAGAGGFGAGYFTGARDIPEKPVVLPQEPILADEQSVLPAEEEEETVRVALPAEFVLPVRYEQLGPQLLEAGVIDYSALAGAMARANRALTEDQQAILQNGAETAITIGHENAHFLLNLLWAFGLGNRNPILLEDGVMWQHSDGEVGRFASTAGWTVAAKPLEEIYAALPLVNLDEAQQRAVEEVAAGVFRPCCGNPTLFPDCNHGMAMLGLLQLMAAAGATTQELFEAAKYVNAFWFPKEMFETTLYLALTQGTDFAQADPQLATGKLFSAGGFQTVHGWLSENGYLEQAPGGGGSGCGV
jgi:hypothetical protein